MNHNNSGSRKPRLAGADGRSCLESQRNGVDGAWRCGQAERQGRPHSRGNRVRARGRSSGGGSSARSRTATTRAKGKGKRWGFRITVRRRRWRWWRVKGCKTKVFGIKNGRRGRAGTRMRAWTRGARRVGSTAELPRGKGSGKKDGGAFGLECEEGQGSGGEPGEVSGVRNWRKKEGLLTRRATRR